MSIITKTFKVGGVLTNMTSVKLSSFDTTFGVKRNDTDAVVVADDTEMTNSATGIYTYEFDDPAYGLTYTYVLEFVYGGETHHIEEEMTGPVSPSVGTASTLRLNLSEIIQRVSDYLGTGLSPSSDQLQRVLNIINDGYSEFLFPPQIPATRGGLEPDTHDWSFMSPVSTLTLVDGQWQYDLPTDFGGLKDNFTYPVDTSETPRITIIDEGRIRSLRQAGNMVTSDPYYAAIRLKTNTQITGPRWEVLFYPMPDEARVLTYRYMVEHGKLDETILAGAAQITGSGISFTTLTDSSADMSGVEVGDLVILSECSGSTCGIYTVAGVAAAAAESESESAGGGESSESGSDSESAGSASESEGEAEGTLTVITLATSADEAGTCSYRIIKGTVYPVVPMWCHQALVESMLDVAARRHDDECSGCHTNQYLSALSACVRRDRMNFSPRTMGYNGDSSVGVPYVQRGIDLSYDGVPIT